MTYTRQFALVVAIAFAAGGPGATASTAATAVSATPIGVTPQYIGYNMGHYLPGRSAMNSSTCDISERRKET